MGTTTRLEDVASAASETMKDTAEFVTKKADRVRDEFGTTERRMRDLVEEYPIACFLGAVLTGYFVGRIATRF